MATKVICCGKGCESKIIGTGPEAGDLFYGPGLLALNLTLTQHRHSTGHGVEDMRIEAFKSIVSLRALGEMIQAIINPIIIN